MSFLAPAFLVAAGLIAAGVVAIHFIVTREPRMVPLPTARFAPARPVRARARTLRPQDLLLMLLRVLLVLAVGAALAQPVLHPAPRPLARIVVADRSRAVASPEEVADRARALLGAGDALVLLDSSATVVRERGADSLASLAARPARGRISAALVAALRTASAMRESADSLELAIVSPLAEEEIDAATDSIRALWPGAVRLVRVSARRDTASAGAVAVEGAEEDPLRVALPPARGAGRPSVRIVRGALAADDSAWASEGGRVLVHWPAGEAGAAGAATLPAGWAERTAPDTVGAVSAGDAVVVAPFVRRGAFGVAGTGDGGAARVVARWADGEPAAVERALVTGCIRRVAIDVPARGDLVLQPRFVRLVATLTEPCGGRARLAPIDDARAAALAGPPDAGLAAARAFAPPETVPLPLVPWLLAAALVFAAGALLLQRRIAGAGPPGAPGAA